MNVSTSAAVFGLNGPDRWSEWVLALGLAVRREAPEAEGMQKRDSQDCWRLRLVSPEERQPISWQLSEHRRLVLTKNYTVFDSRLICLLRIDRYAIYCLHIQYTCTG